MDEFKVVVTIINGLVVIVSVFGAVVHLTRSITRWSEEMQYSIEHLTTSVNRLDRTLKESVTPKLDDLYDRVEKLEGNGRLP